MIKGGISFKNTGRDRFLACADWMNVKANLKIHGLRWTCQEKARLDAEFEEKMRNLEKDKEEHLLRIHASSLVGENVRQP